MVASWCEVMGSNGGSPNAAPRIQLISQHLSAHAMLTSSLLFLCLLSTLPAYDQACDGADEAWYSVLSNGR